MLLRPILGTRTFFTSQTRIMSSSHNPKEIFFGPFEVTGQVFFQTPLCYALVNIKPILPGHVLVIPFRKVQRITDLTTDEVTDLFTLVQRVQRMLAKTHFGALGNPEDGSFNVAIQDGKEAGQTVPHAHCHVIPRTRDAKKEGDEFYDRLQGEEGNVGGGLWDKERPQHTGKFPKIEDADRIARSVEDMNKEAAFYREQMELL